MVSSMRARRALRHKILKRNNFAAGKFEDAPIAGLAGFVRVDKTKRFKPGLNRPGQNLMSGQNRTKLDKT